MNDHAKAFKMDGPQLGEALWAATHLKHIRVLRLEVCSRGDQADAGIAALENALQNALHLADTDKVFTMGRLTARGMEPV